MEEHPMVLAAGGNRYDACGLACLAAMLSWMTECDPYELARSWVADVNRYTEPEARA